MVGGVRGSSLSVPVAATDADVGLLREATFGTFLDFGAELFDAVVDEEHDAPDTFDCFPCCCCFQGCQVAKFDPFLSLDCARVRARGGAIQGKEGIKFCSVA